MHDPGGRSKPKWRDGSDIDVMFSECGKYRYMLREKWGAGSLVMFLMMNPSTAGIEHADPTLIRTGNYARAWGHGGQLIGNMHAYRVTDSRRLSEVGDPVGPLNDSALMRMAGAAEYVVLAYGQPPRRLRPRSGRVLLMLQAAGVRLKYLALANDGTPKHPLYLKADLLPKDFLQ